MTTIYRTVALFVWLAAPVLAQSVPVPPHTLDGDSPSLGPIAGFCASHRQQILVDERHLRSLVGKQLRGLSFRRDGYFGGALNAAEADLVMSISLTAARAESPSEVFSMNRGPVVVQVFQGRVSAPESPGLYDRTVGWRPPHAINIRFSTPFAYPGGNLCIEIDGQAVGDCFWPFDYDSEGSVGAVSKYGVACGRYAGRYGISATVSAANLRLATSASFYAWAQPRTPGAMMIGDQKQWPGIDLGPLGATGCALYVRPVITTPSAFDAPYRSGEPGTGRVSLLIPSSASLMGSMMWVQWLNIEVGLPISEWSNPLGVTTSNGLEVTVSASPPALGMSTVLSDLVRNGQFPVRGRVNVTRAPVLRFDT